MSHPARALLLALALASGGPLVGCGGTSGDRGPSAPRWEGPLFESFADDIEPAALGLPSSTSRAVLNRQIRDRTVLAEVIARVRVQTISVERRSSGEPVYRIGLQLASPRMLDDGAMADSIEVVIPPGGAAHGLARAWDVRLRGKTFVGFFKTFAGPEGEPVVHFHLAQDSAEVAARVEQVITLEEVKGS